MSFSSFTRTSCSILTLRFIVMGSGGASTLTVGWQATNTNVSTSERWSQFATRRAL